MTTIQRIHIEVGRAILDEDMAPSALGASDEASEGSTVSTASPTRTDGASRAEQRAAMRTSDEDRIANLMSLLCDPESLLTIAQSMLRDSQASGREQDAETRQAAARIQEQLRSDETARALADAAQSREADLFANVCKVIGSALAAVVGVLGCVFTGGASVVAAVGLIVALAGPMICDALAEAGVMPEDVAMGVGIGCAVVGSAMSFGAGAAGGAAQVGSKVAQIALQATKLSLQAAQATATTVQTGFKTIAVVEAADSQHHSAEAIDAESAREQASESADAAAESVATLLRVFTRMAERMREIREARAESMTTLTSALGRA